MTSKKFVNKGPTSKLTEFFSQCDGMISQETYMYLKDNQPIKLKFTSWDSSPSSSGGSRPSDKEGGGGGVKKLFLV